MLNFRRCFLFIIAIYFTITISAQPVPDWNCASLRSEFISYSMRETAEKGDRSGERYFMPLEDFSIDTLSDGALRYSTAIDIPTAWLEREIFLHTEGGRNSHRIHINGRDAGFARDSRLPSEFNITPLLVQGFNTISIESLRDTNEPETGIPPSRPDLTEAFIYSQPRISIVDYAVRTSIPRPGSDMGWLSLSMTVRNTYNYPETVTIGFDIYTPDGKLEHYDLREVSVKGRSVDTLDFSATIYGVEKQLWSAESPKLYNIMMFVRRNGIITEYIPFKTGFGTTEWDSDTLYRNGMPIDIRPVRYNAENPRSALTDLRAMKRDKKNTIYVDYPQPYWFYDMCDALGFYVFDQANINTPANADSLAIGGTLSNDPAWLDEYIARIDGMYYRSRNHQCITGWSIAGESGNGYCLYKAYQHLKELTSLPVVYPYANGEWNTDLNLPEVQAE